MFKDRSDWKRRLIRVAIYAGVLFGGASQKAEAKDPLGIKAATERYVKNKKREIIMDHDRNMGTARREAYKIAGGIFDDSTYGGAIADQAARDAVLAVTKGRPFTIDPFSSSARKAARNGINKAIHKNQEKKQTKQQEAAQQEANQQKAQKTTSERDVWEDDIYKSSVTVDNSATKTNVATKVKETQARSQQNVTEKQKLYNGGSSLTVREDTAEKETKTTAKQASGRKKVTTLYSGGR